MYVLKHAHQLRMSGTSLHGDLLPSPLSLYPFCHSSSMLSQFSHIYKFASLNFLNQFSWDGREAIVEEKWACCVLCLGVFACIFALGSLLPLVCAGFFGASLLLFALQVSAWVEPPSSLTSPMHMPFTASSTGRFPKATPMRKEGGGGGGDKPCYRPSATQIALPGLPHAIIGNASFLPQCPPVTTQISATTRDAAIMRA